MTAHRPRVVVVANCQARPVAQILSVCTEAQVGDPIILHLARAEEEIQHRQAFESADLILAQLTTDGYKPGHVASQSLLAQYSGKVIIWPNLFYSGQQPFLRYLTLPAGGRVLGPLESYHDLRILRRWASARGVDDVKSDDSAEFNHRRSLDDLRQREARCAVGVADLIEQLHGQRRLFFTFNHPTAWLMERMCERLCAVAGLPFTYASTFKSEPLARIVAPSIWQDWPGQALPYRGQAVSYEAAGKVALREIRNWGPEELETEFFKAYDHVLSEANWSALRYTPNY